MEREKPSSPQFSPSPIYSLIGTALLLQQLRVLAQLQNKSGEKSEIDTTLTNCPDDV